jgi:hypothetical protein
MLRGYITVLILSIFTSAYWWAGKLFDVYRLAFIGAVFELLWLPVLIILFILPIFSLVLLIKKKFRLPSLNLFSLLIVISTLAAMIMRK